MPRKAKSPARAETTGDWDHREAAPASQLDAFGFRKQSAYTPDDAHKVDAQMAKWVAEGKYSDTQGATGSFNDFYVKQLHKIPRPKKTINQEAWAFVLFLSTNLTALLTYAGFFPKLVAKLNAKLAKLPFNDKLGLKIVPFEDTMFMILTVYFGAILTCFLVVILWAIVKDFLDPANSPLDPRKRWAHWPGSKINPGSDQGTPMRYGKKVYVEKTD